MKKVFLLMASVAVLCFVGCSSSDDDVIEVGSVTLNLQSKSLVVGETVTLTATVSPSNAVYTAIVWGSGDESVATVTQEGVVTAVAEGTATITATAGGKSALCVIAVSEDEIEVTSVTLDITSAELLTDETLTLTATVLPNDATDSSVTWSTSDATIATVVDGVVTCVSGGTVTITATAGDKTAECVIECIGDNTNISSKFDSAFAAILETKGIVADANAITYGEIKSIKNITVTDCGLTSLQGIEYFSALTYLACSDNSLTSIDVSKNTGLVSFYCNNNSLTSLDLSKNTALKTLYCMSNGLTSLDLSNNTLLTSLACNGNSLTSLDLSQNTELKTLHCRSTALTSLDVSRNTALQTLDCSNNSLTSLDVSQNIKLTSLSCYYNEISSLDVSQNAKLVTLNCQHNYLNSLDVSQNGALVNLLCNNNSLGSVDLRQNTSLAILQANDCSFTSVDLSQNTVLTSLTLNGNLLTSLDISQNTALERLYVSNTPGVNGYFNVYTWTDGQPSQITIYGDDPWTYNGASVAIQWIKKQ